MGFWDDPEFASDYMKWESIGDSIQGKVLAIGKRTDSLRGGKVVPELTIQVGSDEVKVTCGQAQLRAKVIEAAPNVGDAIRIVFTGEVPAATGKLKEFSVEVKRASSRGAAKAAAKPAAEPAPADDPWASSGGDDTPPWES